MSQPKLHQLSASLLAADPLRLADDLAILDQLNIHNLHVDVMDNHYVPNLSFGPAICEAIHQQFNHMTLDVHLMTQPVEGLIVAFAQRGAKRITIHLESTHHLHRAVSFIKENGCEAGIALNPSEAPEAIHYCQSLLDHVLIMTVNPGFGGQQLVPAVLEKIEYVRDHYPDLTIQVDGGVSADNIASLQEAGAQRFVIGNALFKGKQIEANLAAIVQSLTS